MNTFLELMIKFYDIIYTNLNIESASEVTHLWIEEFIMGPNALMMVIFYMVILNLIHRPKKYKIRLFLAPMWTQVLMRQILFLNMIINPLFFFGAIVLLTLGTIFYIQFHSRIAVNDVTDNPFTTFFS